MPAKGPASVGEYLAGLTDEQREWVDELRSVIASVLPDASEEISYQIVAYKRRGKSVVWYAAFKNHYSLYPATDSLAAALGDRIKPYLSGKGTIRFDARKPVPNELVRDIVEQLSVEAATRYSS